IVDDELSPEQKALIAEKRAAYEARSKKKPEVEMTPSPATGKGRAEQKKAPAPPPAGAGAGRGEGGEEESSSAGFPPGATMCNKCNTSAVVIMDGCATCLSCGYSKCG